MPPQAASLETDALTVERRKPLARWAADHDVDLRESIDVLDRRGANVDAGEVRAIRRGCVWIIVDSEHRSKSAGVVKAARHPTAAGEQVHERVPATVGHGERSYVCRR